MKIPTEKRFEKYIEDELTALKDDGLQFHSLIHSSSAKWYDKALCLVGDEFITFLKETQNDTYNGLEKKYGEDTDKNILKKLSQEIESKGLIRVLRKGFEDEQQTIKTLYFQPTSSLNPSFRNKYLKNKFLLVRQLHYSPHNNKSIDMVIFINGIPILTIELKNQMTGQTVEDADNQYRFDRQPQGEPLLQFRRCVCHFSVDNDEVNMTTKLDGKNTVFLPFNKTLNNSETKSEGYKVEYLWKEILTPTSLLDIIEHFVLFTHTSDFVWNDERKKVKEKKTQILIFPRYHQLEVIRKLKSQVLKDGVGSNYLIQHITGSGKSYSIGWLSYMLAGLFKENGQDTVFDSIIIITDRKVLDKQLQDTVKSLEKVSGVVENIYTNSEQLKKALTKGKKIIITTIQKFSVVVDRIKALRGKKFAVIVDEVHSSQGGKGTKNLKKTLSLNNEDEVEVYENLVNDEILKIRKEMKSRQPQRHISFFGFTGTPKRQTLEAFGTSVEGTDEKKPFHTYTMKQSIGEGFTLDVLKSFTPVKRWFTLRGKGVDVEVPKTQGKKELIKWVDSNPITISRKCDVIIEHLLNTTIPSIQGKGKGMIVVRSINDAVQFFMEMNKQLKEKGYQNKIKCIVGFSGEVDYKGKKIAEYSLNNDNGFDSKDIPMGFKNPLYRVLIACNKFQTGFDEPLLHSMFIDKPLQGVQCVQTLSRLNRKTSGKKDTFVLDFVNKVETVQEAFQNFYQTTILSESTDPNTVNNILDKIKAYGLFTFQEIEDWNFIYFSNKPNDSKLQPILNTVLNRWKELSDEGKDDSRKQFSNYCKSYGYISMVHPFDDVKFEQYYIFFEYLRKKFPIDRKTKFDVSDLVDLESLYLDIKGKQNISLEPKDTTFDPNQYGGQSGRKEEKFDLLSKIIHEINTIYGEISEKMTGNTGNFLDNMANDKALRKVINSENTYSNKRDKLQQIYDNNKTALVDVDTELYNIINKKEIKDKIIHIFISRPELVNQYRTK